MFSAVIPNEFPFSQRSCDPPFRDTILRPVYLFSVLPFSIAIAQTMYAYTFRFVVYLMSRQGVFIKRNLLR